MIMIITAYPRQNSLFEENTSSFFMPELITPEKFSIRAWGKIKKKFCEEKYGMDFPVTIYDGKEFRVAVF